MFDEVNSTGLAWIVFAGVAVASSLAFLRTSTLRSWLISAWVLAPVWLVVWVTVVTTLNTGWDIGGLWFALVFVAFLLPPWLAVTLFPFRLIGRVRMINGSG